MKKIKKMFHRFLPSLELYTFVFVGLMLGFALLCLMFYFSGIMLRFLGFDL